MVLIAITAGFGLIAWQKPTTGLLILIATLPSYLLRIEILGIPTTLLEMMLLTLILTWGVRHVRSLRFRYPVTTITKPIILLILAATISLIVAPNTTAALGVCKAYFIEPIILFLIIRHELTRANITPQQIYKALSLSAIIVSLVAITQYITGAGIPIPWDIERRVTSIFDYPNAVGLFLGPIVMLSTLSVLNAPGNLLTRIKQNSILSAASILGVIAIILAQSEATIVALVATLLIAGLINKSTRKYSIALGILLAIATPLTPPLFQKLTLQDYSGGVRLSQWSETADLLKDKWLLGAGLSGYPSALEPYHLATHLEIFQYPHNILLNFWVELGLLGVIAIAWLATKLTRSPNIIPALALLEAFIHGLVDVPYFKNDLAILVWILIALALYDRTKTHHKKV
ncbi:O-antigen ligase family protein [Candidatus Uhrbacteria bacterium]|nr:O-antigen ligase family protein [Candidatus Uhrbacteria bacterium]